jgi:WD40 repeat protein
MENQGNDEDANLSSARPATGPSTTSEKDSKWKLKNPIKLYIEYRTKKKLERERLMMLREEKMMEDLERYLMEMEDKRSWIVFQLNTLNYNRISRKETLAKITRKQAEKDKIEEEERLKEDGLAFFQGNVESYKRWQNSAAKHLDFVGHQGPVTSCRLSPCLNYMLSCSEDRSLKIWNMKTAECVKTFTGHRKIVNDGDFHPSFQMYRKDLSILSCSGDTTLRLWNSSDPKPMVTINGHKQAVYKCSFSPDGTSFISCSEDRTIRTWSFPEGYSIFVYRAHNAPVVTVRFSYSGR